MLDHVEVEITGGSNGGKRSALATIGEMPHGGAPIIALEASALRAAGYEVEIR